MWRILTAYLLLCFFCNSSHATYFIHYNTSDKLSSNDVYSVFCDGKGFLWFSTDKGVCKYDGENFHSFTILDGIGNNEIFSVFEDSRHKLWLSTFNGNISYIRNDSVFNAVTDPTCRRIEGFFDSTIRVPGVSYHNNIYNIGDTVFYVGHSAEGIVKFDKHGAKVLAQFSPFEHLYLLKKIKELLYIYTSNRTIVLDSSDQIIFSKPYPTRGVFSSNGKLMISDSLGVRVYEHGKLIYTTRAKEFTLRKVSYLYADRAGHIFCATPTGLYIIHYNSRRIDKLFNNKKISYITQDVAGNYWITTIGDGVYFMHKEFEHLTLLNDMNPKVTYRSSKQFFIQEGDTVSFFSEAKASFEKTGVLISTKFIPLYADTDFFFAVYRDSFYVFNRHKRTLKGVFGPSLKNIIYLDKGKYLFHYPLMIVQCDLNAADAIFSDTVFADARISKMLYDAPHKNAYYLQNNSLYVHNILSGKTSVIKTLVKPSQFVDMYQVGGGLLLFTNNQHIITYKEGRLYDFKPVMEGLAVYGVYDMMHDLYMVQTNKGYLVWDNKPSSFFKPFQFVEYPFNNACLNNLYAAGKHMVADVDGKLYLFDKAILNRELAKPKNFIDKIYIDNKIYSGGDIVLKNTIQCNMRITIGGLYFNHTDNTYQYRIVKDGVAGSWLKNDGRILNINLNTYGEYRIDVIAVTNNGIKSAIASTNMRLVPPFYYTTSFYWVLVIVSIICLMYGIHFYHTWRRKKLQNELTYTQLEYKAVNSLLNPHFIFNAINNIQHLITNNSGDIANEYLVKLSRLIRQNVENLQFNLIPLDKELELIQNYIYLQNLRYDNNIIYKLQDNIGITDDISIPPLLLHTIIENSIVHGYRNDGNRLHIVLDISMTIGDYILMTIADDGNGYRPQSNIAVDKSSLGLNTTRKRLERLSAYFKVQYSLDIYNRRDSEGTEVVIKLYSKFSELAVP